MSNPVIGYNNLLESGTVSASTEATGYEKENAFDWLTYDWWKPTAVTAYLTVDMGSATACDYFALAGHDLGTQGAGVVLQYSTDNFAADINDAFTTLTPSDDSVIFQSFTSQSKRYWRVKLTTAVASLGTVAFGERLDMPEGMGVGFIPPTMSFDDDVTNNRAHGGAYLGRSVLREGASGSISFDLLTPAFVRSDWMPFIEHARSKPFFLSWDETNYSGEAAYCWTDGAITPPKYSHTNYMSASLKYKALTK